MSVFGASKSIVDFKSANTLITVHSFILEMDSSSGIILYRNVVHTYGLPTLDMVNNRIIHSEYGTYLCIIHSEYGTYLCIIHSEYDTYTNSLSTMNMVHTYALSTVNMVHTHIFEVSVSSESSQKIIT